MKDIRVNLAFFIFILIGFTLVARLFFLQVISGEHYRALAQGQQKQPNFVIGDRGQIKLKTGQILAGNIKGKYVYIVPPVFAQEKGSDVDKMAEILGLDKEEISAKDSKISSFEILKRRLSDIEIQKIQDAEIAGVFLQQETWRDYPLGTFASNIIGFLGGEGKGQYGLEGFYEEELSGKEGIGIREKSPLRFLFENTGQDGEKLKGSDLILTLDYNIQFMAEKFLEENHEKFLFRRGLILVMDPNDGRILSLAEYPGFDLNKYNQEKDSSVFQSFAAQSAFEPGSVMKAVTMASALNENSVSPLTTYEDAGSVTLNTRTIFNFGYRKYGMQTMTQVLEKSINTGAVYAEQQLGHGNFLQYMENFGFFESTGIDLQGEIYSGKSQLEKGQDINFATAAFGQGIETTPMQLARAFAALANGGELVKPFIAETVGGKPEFSGGRASGNQRNPISPETSQKISAMLTSVVENGFGKKAKIPGYYLAGKTGTAQIPFSALGINKVGYSEETIQSFIGYGPSFNPKFLILVRLDNPQASTAEYSAMPIFRQMAKYIIDYWRIPPDYK